MHFLQEIWGSAVNMLALKAFQVRHAFLHIVIGVKEIEVENVDFFRSGGRMS
jgi:hypothetical protein